MTILFRLAEQVAHLPFEGVEPLIKRDDGGLGRCRFTGVTGSVGGASARENLPLHLVDLALKAVDPLLRRDLLTLGGRGGWNQRDAETSREAGDPIDMLH